VLTHSQRALVLQKGAVVLSGEADTLRRGDALASLLGV
jgi:ABC-type branched-subunit amino acid transport system ATPase component